jgi:hypothetical protein
MRFCKKVLDSPLRSWCTFVSDSVRTQIVVIQYLKKTPKKTNEIASF